MKHVDAVGSRPVEASLPRILKKPFKTLPIVSPVSWSRGMNGGIVGGGGEKRRWRRREVVKVGSGGG